jgi:hypothetical protein
LREREVREADVCRLQTAAQRAGVEAVGWRRAFGQRLRPEVVGSVGLLNAGLREQRVRPVQCAVTLLFRPVAVPGLAAVGALGDIMDTFAVPAEE